MCHQDKGCMWIKILKLWLTYTRQKKKSQIWGMFSLAFGLRGIYKLQPKKGKTKENHKVKDINQQSRQILPGSFLGWGLHLHLPGLTPTGLSILSTKAFSIICLFSITLKYIL